MSSTNREFEPRVKETIEGLAEDFKQAIINECNRVADFGEFEKINFICLESAMKVVPNILRSVVQGVTIGTFGDEMGKALNDGFDINAERRVTKTMAIDILERKSDELPKEVKERIQEIIKSLSGEDKPRNENT